MEHQLDTIRRVRAFIDQYNPACDLEVDGGINPVTRKRWWKPGPMCWWQAQRCTAHRTFHGPCLSPGRSVTARCPA